MKRKTRETDVTVELDVAGEIRTGDGVLDHLLTALFFYMGREANVKASYDLRHHLWEDVGIVLGEELRSKLPERFARFGNAAMPMDDALVLVVVDISGRPYVSAELTFEESEEGFEVSLVREFLWGLARSLKATIHVKTLSGVNAHHVIEAAFKGLGVALGRAIQESGKLESTKGLLEV
ncbi:imidazoleglycerol-phosphate dehydratase HisB [Thermococcus thioreducens]|uniref:Imidazoleglycerol-phosphate dehydratase n=1 Tax=Thermococcus thioreducens TaxID=277988 RepID=A0A0Q2MQT5_9EURY|nr:imidazoleglycerol-phosphate dehydratase HisB [Thermococcus thioreducens]ASJ12726.1 imidazoleglycerol-phosphate dehydratase [Thermococcus thioreducens]KQH82055.1 imidazoleglycerol-phosphate dehydratase [Thermococcus thioreducens]SEV86144.1 imidazoleglycerol-phosphate dehydratase [Thermococcus thioreducens]